MDYARLAARSHFAGFFFWVCVCLFPFYNKSLRTSFCWKMLQLCFSVKLQQCVWIGLTVPEFKGSWLQVLSSVQSNDISPPLITFPLQRNRQSSAYNFNLKEYIQDVLYGNVLPIRSTQLILLPWKTDSTHNLKHTVSHYLLYSRQACCQMQDNDKYLSFCVVGSARWQRRRWTPAVRKLPGSSPDAAQNNLGAQEGWQSPHAGSPPLQSLKAEHR